MKESYRQTYEYLFRNHWWWRSRERLLLHIIRSFSLTPAPRTTCSILDVGCGEGLFFSQLTQFGSVTGSEPSLPGTCETPYGTIYPQPLEDATVFATGGYDLVLLLDVLEHITDDRSFLEATLRVLRPGGYLLITVPAHQWLWTAHDHDNMHVRRYSRRSLQTLLAHPSLRVERCGSLFCWVGCVKWLATFWERVTGKTFHGTTMPPHFINRALTALTTLEGRLLLSLPVSWGSSLYAVVKRLPSPHTLQGEPKSSSLGQPKGAIG